MKVGQLTRKTFFIITTILFLPCIVFAAQDKATTDTQKIIVSYFHGDLRCHACLNIERYAEEIVKKHFAKEIAGGVIEWRAVNFDKKGNEHFLADYNLPSPAVILSEVKNGKDTRWKNLDKIWDREPNKEAFNQYIIMELTKFIKSPETLSAKRSDEAKK